MAWERAGLWKYDANTTGQVFGFAERYVTGLRNTVGLAFHPTAGLFALQHGRDLLHQNWPERFSLKQGSEVPAEILVRVVRGADYGWPYCYYDGLNGRYVLAPEYGGDGSTVGRCAGTSLPVAVFPVHWAPNALVFYQGGPALPERYHGIAPQGWRRVPTVRSTSATIRADGSGASRGATVAPHGRRSPRVRAPAACAGGDRTGRSGRSMRYRRRSAAATRRRRSPAHARGWRPWES